MTHSRSRAMQQRHPLIATGVVTLLSLGCVMSPSRQLPVQLRWPEPPLTTRIEYVRSIASAYDLAGKPGRWERFTEFLLGTKSRTIGIGHPQDIEVSADGTRLFVSDFAKGVVHAFNLQEGTVRHLGERSRFARPFGLALDPAGNLWVVEQAERQIRILSPLGATLRVIKNDHLIRPADIAIDADRDRVYVADPSHQRSPEHYVRVFDIDGNYLGHRGRGKGMSAGALMFPTYVAVDGDGNLYVSDTLNSRVSVFDEEGRFLRSLGTRGDGFGAFDKPKGVAFDSFGNLYVVDSSWSNIQIFGPGGDVLLFFGGRGGYPGLLRNPTGIAIAGDTNTIYVGDYLNHRVVVYQLVNTGPGDGMPTTNN